MKAKEKEQAIKLRKDGVSVLKISQQLNVSQSSVSVWTRGILTPEETRQKSLDRIKEFGAVGIKNAQKKHLDRRGIAFENGRNKAKEGNILHSWGCMLYWAEGGKSGRRVYFCNTDVDMILLFKKFLIEELKVLPEEIILRVKFHDKSFDNKNLDKHEIEKFWKERMGDNFKRIDIEPMTSTGKIVKKKNRHWYGLCSLTVHNTDLLYHILGAIEEYKLMGIK